MAGDSRERMVRSAASLISARGVSATSFSDVVADSGAPRGSIYHHFPDGKRQLAIEAVRWTAQQVLDRQRAAAPATPEAVLRTFMGMWRAVVVASDARAGCAIAGVAVDTGITAVGTGDAEETDDAQLLRAARDGFRSWIALLTEQLAAAGVPAGRAGPLARTTLAAMEGALILCRAERSVGPLDEVAAEILGLLG